MFFSGTGEDIITGEVTGEDIITRFFFGFPLFLFLSRVSRLRGHRFLRLEQVRSPPTLHCVREERVATSGCVRKVEIYFSATAATVEAEAAVAATWS
ncbi:hypothetical protein TIFTF001_012588 [Ficus carica]|uniref:Uncharacterized protein n=1 Tax=Ficus carica TaxID=3494 RepID=A0AA88D1Z2_FICCA|nr:hypothetical protein TIFTF001_012588 [Ficus carica]